jgi:TPR repeat protein/putative methionine-R-sulfoxide reductase with GAF domain
LNSPLPTATALLISFPADFFIFRANMYQIENLGSFMSSLSSTLASKTPNRRRRVRHKIQTPAYASFADDPKNSMLELHEIVDISEDGMAIQCHSPLSAEKRLNLLLDLADCPSHIETPGLVVWSNETGRTGVRFSDLSPESLVRLREWLFVNVMAGVANGETEIPDSPDEATPPRANYTDTLAAVTAVQREVESLGTNINAALQLIAERARTFLRASGSAIALAEDDPEFMVCKASSGNDAPPKGARLQVGSGFSGECVKTGTLLCCDDAESDSRVDQEICRALGIRSMLAAPVRKDGKSVGLIETFGPQPNAFTDGDERVLQRLADIITALMNGARQSGNSSGSAGSFAAPQGSVLFASADQENEREKGKEKEKKNERTASGEKASGGISLPRSHLIILGCAAATIFLVLGVISAPTIQSDVLPWLNQKFHSRPNTQVTTVLASSQAPKSDSPVAPSVETASFDQLRQMAEKGDSVAQNAMGLRFATGDGVKLSETEAVRWFIKAAEQGYVPAQSKLGSLYYSGRGVPQDSTRAYFWMAVARMSGDEASKTLSPFVRARLTRAQVTSIELEADRWLQQHRSQAEKPAAGQLKARN